MSICEVVSDTRTTGTLPSLDPNWSAIPPESCTLTLVKNFATELITSLWLTYFDFDGNSEPDSCYPPNYRTSAGDSNHGYYSPGFKCPGGWTQVNSTVLTPLFTTSGVDPLTTAITCCPLGYYASLLNADAACTGTITTQKVVPFRVLPERSSITGITTITTGTGIIGRLVLYHQSEDLLGPRTVCRPKPSEPTASEASTSSTAPAETTATPSTTDIGATSLKIQGGGSHISPGAIAGIVVGICLLALLVAAFIIFLRKRRRRRRKQTPGGGVARQELDAGVSSGRSEMDGKEKEIAQPSSTRFNETAEVQNPAVELPADNYPQYNAAASRIANAAELEAPPARRYYETEAAPMQETSVAIMPAQPRVEHHASPTSQDAHMFGQDAGSVTAARQEVETTQAVPKHEHQEIPVPPSVVVDTTTTQRARDIPVQPSSAADTTTREDHNIAAQLQRLDSEEARIKEQRARLAELQRLDDEEARIKEERARLVARGR